MQMNKHQSKSSKFRRFKSFYLSLVKEDQEHFYTTQPLTENIHSSPQLSSWIFSYTSFKMDSTTASSPLCFMEIPEANLLNADKAPSAPNLGKNFLAYGQLVESGSFSTISLYHQAHFCNHER